ncbi:MAG: hypothetical protein AMS23_10015 [Bacteroides sp. SM1_62]|nr:MAG: hypothetical protein AMS26_12290 [Bacteroides sp. SM23_62]KPL20996.1 MAG: hypothetical protein AMS23_10015 [Bacteroides sp. SM1_62]
MKKVNGDRARLNHILAAIDEILNYVDNYDFDAFLKDSKTKFATIKQLEIIGEAANHITEETKLRFTNVEWQKIGGLRNILVHEYFGIDENIVWGIIVKNLPELKNSIQCILQKFN